MANSNIGGREQNPWQLCLSFSTEEGGHGKGPYAIGYTTGHSYPQSYLSVEKDIQICVVIRI